MSTTHIFIVDGNTLKYHLEYLFAGTGAGECVIDFNNSGNSYLHSTTENNLLGMIADFSRVKNGDNAIFYLQQNFSQNIKEGKFFGIFKINSTVFLDNNDDNQFLKNKLKKSLTFRVKILPYKVYKDGVTEWEALDEIKNIVSPYQMLWSLIYRKLKGNRGNTMITHYEFDRLNKLIRNKNNNQLMQDNNFTFDIKTQQIKPNINTNIYNGRMEKINILPRLIEKYNKGLQFETHLQAYILQNIDYIHIFKYDNLDWIGNEVSCGVGMQRIDIMLSITRKDEKICIPIKLKSTEFYSAIIIQIQRYVDWIQQYYLPNHISDIEPIIICRNTENKQQVIECIKKFNYKNDILKLRYIEFNINNNNIYFLEINY